MTERMRHCGDRHFSCRSDLSIENRMSSAKLLNSSKYHPASFVVGCLSTKRFVLTSGNFLNASFLFIGYLSKTSGGAFVVQMR